MNVMEPSEVQLISVTAIHWLAIAHFGRYDNSPLVNHEPGSGFHSSYAVPR